MSEVKTTPKVMTMKELEAEVKQEESKLEKGESVPVVAEEIPAPPQEPAKPAEEPKEATPEVTPETDIQKQLADRDSKITELTKRLRDTDGRHGGELAALREQVANLGNQLRDLIAENRELKAKPSQPAEPPEPDALVEQYPEVAKGIDRRAQPAIEAAKRAEDLAKQNQEELQKIRADQKQREYQSFVNTIRTAVSAMDRINSNPEFIEWCGQREEGSAFTRMETLERCSRELNPGPAIEIFQRWEKEHNTTPKTETPKGPARPSKEAQVEVPKSSAPTSKAKGVDPSKRLKELEDKVFKGIGKPMTKDERDEYYRLLDEKERGNLTQ